MVELVAFQGIRAVVGAPLPRNQEVEHLALPAGGPSLNSPTCRLDSGLQFN